MEIFNLRVSLGEGAREKETLTTHHTCIACIIYKRDAFIEATAFLGTVGYLD
jgi:hypothetical protein